MLDILMDHMCNLMMKRIAIFLFLLAFMGVGLTSSFGAGIEDEQWLTPNRVEPGFQGIRISDEPSSFELFSELHGSKNVSGLNNDYMCSAINSGDCLGSQSYWYNTVLPPCSDATSVNCIVGISASEGNVVKAVGQYSSTVYPNHMNLYSGDSKVGLPNPSEPSIWNMSGAPHSAGSEYAVVVGLGGGIDPNKLNIPSSFYAYIMPVSKVLTGAPRMDQGNQDGFKYYYPRCQQKSLGTAGEARTGCLGWDSGIGPNNTNCALFIDEGPDCYVRHAFPQNLTFTLNVRLSSPVNGWIHGRVSNPQIKIVDATSGVENISISANPIKVPIFYAGNMYKDLPAGLQSAYATRATLSSGGFSGRICCDLPADPLLRNASSTPHPYGEDSITEMKLWLDYANNSSVATPSQWSVHTLDQNQMSQAGPCFTTGAGLKGIVATNSTTYSAGPPTFVDGSLNYHVSSPHFNPDKTDFKGTYNLVMRDDVARCLYKFSNAPVKATVQVITEDGKTDIATTSVTDKDGWLSMGAANFTFSAPTVKVRLTQDSAPVVVIPSSNVSAKKSITCLKGKVSKIVTAIKPICPSGYKQK